MPFGYYDRLSRKEQAIYRESDRHTAIALPEPSTLQPVVDTLAEALAAEDRAATQRASERLVQGLVSALRMPPVRVEVLAARPRNNYGELHGLYTAERHRTPKIQLWMRTAAQKRVVAFKTYLRTLLHEVGHHIDYTHLGLAESFHTEGFYKRESSLFYQLAPDARTKPRTVAEWAARPVDERLRRLARTPLQVAEAIAGGPPARVVQGVGRAPVEIVAYLRDAEELFMDRIAALLAMDEPVLPAAAPVARWTTERQYRRHDATLALEHFRVRRGETLALLMSLEAEQWTRAGIHPTRGRLTIDDFVTLMAWNDDQQLAELTQSLKETTASARHAISGTRARPRR